MADKQSLCGTCMLRGSCAVIYAQREVSSGLEQLMNELNNQSSEGADPNIIEESTQAASELASAMEAEISLAAEAAVCPNYRPAKEL